MKLAPAIEGKIFTPAFKTDPFSTYARWREHHPVCRLRLPTGEEAHVVTRYAGVSQLLKSPQLAKDPANALTPEQFRQVRQPPRFFAMLQRNMLALDDPDHARLKRLVQATFVPRRVEQLAEETSRISRQLLDCLQPGEPFDLVRDYANPLPVRVISELLGVPGKDQQRFARWSNALIQVAGPGLAPVMALPGVVSFMRYLRKLIAMKRSAPDDRLVSALIAAEEDGRSLDGDELLAMVSILLSAGHETTQNLIANGMLALMDHPEEKDRLARNMALMPTAIEELLRFAGPVETSTFRYAREELEIGGIRIPQGALVLGVIASGNRDERHFDHADRLDLTRSVNRHLSFGEGGHYCLGAALARVEAGVAFAHLLERFPFLRLAEPRGAVNWNEGVVLRGLRRLRVSAATVRR